MFRSVLKLLFIKSQQYIDSLFKCRSHKHLRQIGSLIFADISYGAISEFSPFCVIFLCEVEVLVTQLCLTLWDPMDCTPPGSSVHGNLPARIPEWVAFPFSRGSSWPRDPTRVSCTAGRFFTVWFSCEATLNSRSFERIKKFQE